MLDKLQSLYLRNGMVFIPTQLETEAGFYKISEPMAALSVSDKIGLRAALLAAIARGNPVIPTPSPYEKSPQLLPKYAGVKSWSAFVRGASTWSIYHKDGAYSINWWHLHPNGSFVPDVAQKISFPAGTPVETVVERMIAILEESAKAQATEPS